MDKITQEDALYRVIDKVVPTDRDALLEEINGSVPMKIKFGTDPTGTDLHFGHAVNLWAMRAMQDRGHKVDLVIGDVTAKIGDPTGRNQERGELGDDKVSENAALFLGQIEKVLRTDPSVFEIHRNSKWYGAMNAMQFIEILRKTTVTELLARSDFKTRIDSHHPIHGHELVYQLLQGHDSVHLGTDLAICGDDQLTNELMGRKLQQASGQKPQMIMTTRLTPGIDGGKKQSKSVGNYIGLSHSPEEQFRRIMSIPDALIPQYFEVYTDLLTSQIKSLVGQTLELDPRKLKMELARAMLRRYHSVDIVERAAESYEKAAAERKYPSDAPVHFVDEDIDLVAFAADILGVESKKAFIRLIQGGAVSIDGTKISESDLEGKKFMLTITRETVVKFGKNRWAVIKPSSRA